MDRLEVIKKMLGLRAMEVPIDILKKAIEDPTVQQRINKKKQNYVLVLWDKKTKINGIEANAVLTSMPFLTKANYIYLIMKNQEVIAIQPSLETEEKTNEIGKKHIDSLAEEDVFMEIAFELTQKYTEKKAPTEITLQDIQKQIEILKGSILEITSTVMGGDE